MNCSSDESSGCRAGGSITTLVPSSLVNMIGMGFALWIGQKSMSDSVREMNSGAPSVVFSVLKIF